VTNPAPARLGIDIGGTFTDVVLIDSENVVWERKVPTTSGDYAQAVAEGVRGILQESGVSPASVGQVVHATTIGTNTILERSGGPIGLITTAGFRDILEIARIRTPTLYDLEWQKPEPLVPRRHRLEVRERVSAGGEVIEPLDPDTVREAGGRLEAAGITSVAVCLINSYVEPRHEREVGAILEREFPGLAVSISSDVLPEIKEYERTSTTVVNAYLAPVMRGYLAGMSGRLAQIGVTAQIQVLRSDGGTMSGDAASERPIFVVGSGPSAGVIAARSFAAGRGVRDVIAFDMGGTTAKASVIEDGRFNRIAEYEVRGGISSPSRFIKAGGYLLMTPAIDLAEVGNGAGSIARVDAAGGLRVGPASAGATPGPACYGRGGAEATITDANVVLGYLNQEALLAGDLPIDRELAEGAISRRVAEPLGVGLIEAAFGVHAMASSNMIRALRAVTVERGRDPRQFTLCAFGGSGPVHIASMASELGIATVIVPPLAGLFSSFGLLFADVEHQFSRGWLAPLLSASSEEMDTRFAELERQALRAMQDEGFRPELVELERTADLRYAGQSAVVTVELSPVEGDILTVLAHRFEEEHRRSYGRRLVREPVEFISLRVRAYNRTRGGAERVRVRMRRGRRSRSASRLVYFGRELGMVEAPVIGRDDLDREPCQGPVIVDEYDCTTVVPPSARVRIDDASNIVVQL
jgi:N-methylhydantoinase A